MLSRGLLVARTVRHLTAKQLAYQVLRRVLPPSAKSTAGAHRVAARLPAIAGALARWADVQDTAASLRRADDVVRGRFTFLNHAETLPSIGWTRRYVSHLWSYNLHYFEYGVDLALAHRATGDATYAQAFTRLSREWIAGTKSRKGDGWEPYALSMRIAHWSYALLLFGDALEPEVRDELFASLHAQLDVLSRRLEWHILANHLQKNLHALLVGSLLFDDADAVRWRATALGHLWPQLAEQVLPDGMHYERAPMYHALALADFTEDLLLLEAAGIAVPAAAVERVGAMARVMEHFVRADGSLSLFNDSAMGIARSPETLRRIVALVLPDATTPEPGGWALPRSGYYGLRSDDVNIVVDCGDPGPGYQPGHAHCDVLSYELDVLGRPLVVDAGLHGYEGDPYRRYVRSTRAHNTVSIGGQEQSEIWSTFRMARRAEIVSADATTDNGTFTFRGGYHPFHDRGATHERTIVCSNDHLEVRDTVRGALGAPLESYIHLHPDCAVEVKGGVVSVEASSFRADITPFGSDEVVVVRGATEPMQGWFCPQFGIAQPNAAIALRIGRNDGRAFGYRITWHAR